MCDGTREKEKKNNKIPLLSVSNIVRGKFSFTSHRYLGQVTDNQCMIKICSSRSKRRSFVSANSLRSKFKITIILILGAMNNIFYISDIVSTIYTSQHRFRSNHRHDNETKDSFTTIECKNRLWAPYPATITFSSQRSIDQYQD